jgi:hypothetical protein
LRSPAMQHDVTKRTQTGDYIGSEVLTRGDIPFPEVASVLQAGHSHRIHPSLAITYLLR